MRTSGFHFFHHWRVIPSKKDNGATYYKALIDGEDKGELKAGDLRGAIAEVERMIEKMLEEAQR